MNSATTQDFWSSITTFFTQPSTPRAIVVILGATIAAFFLSKFLAFLIIKIAQNVSVRSDSESNHERFLRLRQVETYLSVTVAIVRAVVTGLVAYVAWIVLNPLQNGTVSASAAAIGASAFFVVFAGQSLGMLLRDMTVGATMIVERWFNVGDYIKIEPFVELSGVVERFTLRSTRIRQLSGEVVWVHNQYIQAVHTTPHGVRTIAVDVFVRDKLEGEKVITKIIKGIPTGPTMLASPLKIKRIEQWGQDLWRITVTGQTTPEREWLIEDYFVNAVKDLDEGKQPGERFNAHKPIAHYADPDADRKFSKAIRTHDDHKYDY